MTFTDICDEFRIEYRLHGEHQHTTSGWVNICCPYCSDTNFKLGINLYSNYATCWSCGYKPLVNLLMELTGLPFHKVKELVKDIPRTVVKEEFAKRGKLALPSNLGGLLPPHKRYLKSRGFNVKQLEGLWGIKGIGFSFTPLAWRIFIPVYYKGEIVTWTTRTIGNDTPRYKAAKKDPESISIRNLLYGEDYCQHTIIVVEGPTDVWRVGPGCVCTCGMGYSRNQLYRISKYPNRIICFDSTPDAQVRARKLLRQLDPYPGRTRNVVLQTGKDACEATDEEVAELRSFLG